MSEFKYLEWYWSTRNDQELIRMINDEGLLDAHRREAQEELDRRVYEQL